jgi:hypothetical protein
MKNAQYNDQGSLKMFCHASDAAKRLVTTVIQSISDIEFSFNFKLTKKPHTGDQTYFHTKTIC